MANNPTDDVQGLTDVWRRLEEHGTSIRNIEQQLTIITGRVVGFICYKYGEQVHRSNECPKRKFGNKVEQTDEVYGEEECRLDRDESDNLYEEDAFVGVIRRENMYRILKDGVRLAKEAQEIQMEVKKRIEKANARYKAYVDPRRRVRLFDVGDEVMVFLNLSPYLHDCGLGYTDKNSKATSLQVEEDDGASK
ncbi:unnamed protein product [Dovyalis caffra]|uniref:Uncharacterized protein n=1 Tax=Dovyalis caffra TaxID=77055 RepID=A0AAV1QQK2_9ROSI|nr:unnamed protein product [Dovyalis caffra]